MRHRVRLCALLATAIADAVLCDLAGDKVALPLLVRLAAHGRRITDRLEVRLARLLASLN